MWPSSPPNVPFEDDDDPFRSAAPVPYTAPEVAAEEHAETSPEAPSILSYSSAESRGVVTPSSPSPTQLAMAPSVVISPLPVETPSAQSFAPAPQAIEENGTATLEKERTSSIQSRQNRDQFLNGLGSFLSSYEVGVQQPAQPPPAAIPTYVSDALPLPPLTAFLPQSSTGAVTGQNGGAVGGPAPAAAVVEEDTSELDSLMDFLGGSISKPPKTQPQPAYHSSTSTTVTSAPSAARKKGLFDDLESPHEAKHQQQQAPQLAQQQSVAPAPSSAGGAPDANAPGSGPHNRTRSRGKIDLSEARRRTSLLTGAGGSGSSQTGRFGSTSSTSGLVPPSPLTTIGTVPDPVSDPYGTGNTVADPLSATATGAGGGYFNESQHRHSLGSGGSRGHMFEGDSGDMGGSFLTPSGNFSVTFGEGRLGFTLQRQEGCGGVVTKTQPGGTAANLGVRASDILISINRRRCASYEEAMDLILSVERPVMLTFKRPDAGVPSGIGSSSTYSQNTISNSSFEPSHQQQITPSSAGGGAGSWRVSREDLTCRRPDFHGIVVRAFGGVFSWSLYGTSDSTDPGAGGESFTTYVMRCQWGPDADSMQPWMVMRRYREFDAFDKDLREAFSHLKDSFVSLPPKELFKNSQEVVARRRRCLEHYMTYLIGSCPEVLSSHHMDKFLMISERTNSIRADYARRAQAARIASANLQSNPGPGTMVA